MFQLYCSHDDYCHHICPGILASSVGGLWIKSSNTYSFSSSPSWNLYFKYKCSCVSSIFIILTKRLSYISTFQTVQNASVFFRIGYLTYADYFFFCCFAFLGVNIGIFLLVLIVRRNGRRREEVSQKNVSRKFDWVLILI